MHRIATIPLKRNFTFLCTKLRKQEASLQMLNTKASFRIKENLAPAWTSSLPFNLTEYSGDLVRLFSTLNMSNRAKTAAKPSKAPFEAEFSEEEAETEPTSTKKVQTSRKSSINTVSTNDTMKINNKLKNKNKLEKKPSIEVSTEEEEENPANEMDIEKYSYSDKSGKSKRASAKTVQPAKKKKTSGIEYDEELGEFVPGYKNFENSSYAWKYGVDYRENPHLYKVGKGEQGVLICQPYKAEICPHWKFRTPDIARASSQKILAMLQDYLKTDDFVGADLARKYIQMGFTRARRYTNYKGGKKYSTTEGQLEKGTGDPIKAESAQIFFDVWQEVERDPVYKQRKEEWKKKYG